MDKGSFGKRNQLAQERILAAMSKLAGGSVFADRLAAVQERNPEYKALFQREIVADFLDAMAASLIPVEAATAAPLVAVPVEYTHTRTRRSKVEAS